MNSKFKFAGTYGLCIGVVFGTAVSYFGKNSSKSYVNIMSKYITGSAVSIVALLSIKGLINMPSRISSKPSSSSSSSAAAAARTPPLEHLRILNYQNFSISSSSSISAISLSCSTTSLPMNIHLRSWYIKIPMKFSGELFTYDNESNLTAFETGPTTEKTVVFIGGLGDGFNAVPYLEPLAVILEKSKWSLTQVLLSSSYNQYGFSNLKNDVKQLDLLIHHLKEKRGKSKIVFLGHSTGSQDCYWHNKYGQISQDIAGYIVQAPVSDREHFKANLDNFQFYLDLAIQLRKEGKGRELLPRNAFWAPVTADRFFSFASKGGDDDVFSTDLTEEEIKALYENVKRPICWIYSDQDEFYASKQDKLQVMKRFQDICPAIKLTANVPYGNHNITREDSQKYFCRIVDEFLQLI